MKKYLLVFLTALAAVMVSSCKKDNDELDNPNGPWSIELTAKCDEYTTGRNFVIELAGTGTVTIDWGDGTALENFQMLPYKDDSDWSEITHTHQYDKDGIYSVTVSGQDGAITLFSIESGSEFSSLVLKHCSQLQHLLCDYNQLTSIDISECSQLKVLDCSNNRLTSLDVSKCTQLQELYCAENQLTSLDVSKNTQLKELSCAKNQLTSLDVSKNTQLKELYCSSNELTSLDVSKNRQLKYLKCYDNRLPVVVMNKIYNDLPVVGQGEGDIYVDWSTAGDYYIAENKGWQVHY